MRQLGQWLIGAIFGVLAILGLAFAANAHDGGFHFFGLIMSAFGILMLVRMINLATGSDGGQAL